MNPAKTRVGLGLIATITCSSAIARAQDAATAQALFDEGKRLMDAKSYAEACPKLVESQRLDPGGGTLFAIALCHEGEGKTATAWADYNAALAEAKRTGRKDREEAAAKKEAELEPKLTRMRIVVANKTPGLTVSRDGTSLAEPLWGVALPIDPGEHVFAAKAPGKIDWEKKMDLRGEAKTIDVAIPALADAPLAIPDTPPAEVPVAKPKPPPPEEGPNAQKTWAVVVGAIGVVGLGVGAGFGISAISQWSDAETKCPGNRCTDRKDEALGEDAGTAADLSTVLVGVGAGALIAGVVLYITAPRSDRRGLYLAPSRSGMGLTVGGTL